MAAIDACRISSGTDALTAPHVVGLGRRRRWRPHPTARGRRRCAGGISRNATSLSTRGSPGRPSDALADDVALDLVGAAADRDREGRRHHLEGPVVEQRVGPGQHPVGPCTSSAARPRRCRFADAASFWMDATARPPLPPSTRRRPPPGPQRREPATSWRVRAGQLLAHHGIAERATLAGQLAQQVVAAHLGGWFVDRRWRRGRSARIGVSRAWAWISSLAPPPRCCRRACSARWPAWSA